jgi:hypothetical protein
MGESERARGGGGIRGWRSGVVILKNPTADAGRGTGAAGLTGGETGGAGGGIGRGAGDGYRRSGVGLLI